MATVNIRVDWNSEKSIELAEQAKAKLENDGWTLVNIFESVFHYTCGINTSILVYADKH